MTAITRAVHLLFGIDVLRELGSPVERELARAKLPTLVEEMPDAYISEEFAFNFMARCARLEGIDDLGYLAAQRMRLLDLSPDFLLAAQRGYTVRARIEQFARHAALESNALCVGLQRQGSNTRISCDLEYAAPEEDLRLSEWLQIKALIEIVRSGAGAHWQPARITFVSRPPPSDRAMEQFGDIRVGQETASIIVPTALLATPVNPLRLPQKPAGSGQPAQDIAGDTDHTPFVDALQKAIQPYLRSGYPPIALAAEIAETSQRTFQRRLKQHGLTYSDVVARARFDAATELLRDPSIKVIDVAMSVGYEDASNFSRAFRRTAGMSPQEFRSAGRVLPQVA